MEPPEKTEVRALLEFIRDCYSIGDVENFKRRIISRLAKVIQPNVRRYNELGPPPILKYRANGVQQGCSGSEAEPLARDIHKNPPCNHHPNNREATHEHSSKPNGRFHQTLRIRHRTAAQWSINSKPNRRTNHFEKRSALLAERATRYLFQSHRNQQKLAVIEHALNTLNLGLIVLTPHKKVRLVTPFAMQQMGNYFGQKDVDNDDLPQALRTWVNQQQLAFKGNNEAGLRGNPFVLEHRGRRLIIRVVFDSHKIVILFEERSVTKRSRSVVSWGLSSRESEILHWLSQGKTNKDIGVILKLSARTVQKHLEHVYQKMGVENRTCASAKAYELTSKIANHTIMVFLAAISSLILVPEAAQAILLLA